MPFLQRLPIFPIMILDAAFLALQRLVTPPLRSMLWKSLGITLVFLVLLWFGVRALFFNSIWPWLSQYLPGLPDWLGWFGIVGTFVFGIGLATVLAFLIAPITALIGGFFIDDVAEIIEKQDYPADKPGKALPLGRAMMIACRFAVLSLVGNGLVFLFGLFIPGFHLIAFPVVNGYLLGREYFEFAASRLLNEKQAHGFYQQNALTVFLSGVLIACFLSVPLLNLLTPLFAASLMVHLYKKLSRAKNKAAGFHQ